jgi:hypothetical protein
MVKWENTFLPKEFGGGGADIINTRTLNEALSIKWAWRVYTHKDNDVCCQLPERKYLSRKPFPICNNKKGSQF